MATKKNKVQEEFQKAEDFAKKEFVEGETFVNEEEDKAKAFWAEKDRKAAEKQKLIDEQNPGWRDSAPEPVFDATQLQAQGVGSWPPVETDWQKQAALNEGRHPAQFAAKDSGESVEVEAPVENPVQVTSSDESKEAAQPDDSAVHFDPAPTSKEEEGAGEGASADKQDAPKVDAAAVDPNNK